MLPPLCSLSHFVSIDMCIECISWCVQVTTAHTNFNELAYRRWTLSVYKTNLIIPTSALLHTHTHSYNCEKKTNHTHTYWFQIRSDVMPFHAPMLFRTSSHFGSSACNLRKFQRTLHFMDVNWCRFLPYNLKKLIFRWVIMHYSNLVWNWILQTPNHRMYKLNLKNIPTKSVLLMKIRRSPSDNMSFFFNSLITRPTLVYTPECYCISEQWTWLQDKPW